MRVAGWSLLAALVGFIVFCGVWRVQGGRWENVTTPSMGTEAPVGSLLWVKPVDVASLRPGDFISFHPPGNRAVTYSHRVYQRSADGTLTTKGVLSAPDPWRLSASDVVGSVRMRWYGVGWLVVAAPVLVVGFLVVAGVRSVVRWKWKLPVALVLGSLVVSIAITVYRPLVNAEQLAFAPSATSGADATYVGTGLLPVRLTAFHGPTVVMHAGEVGRVHVSTVGPDGKLRVTLKPAIPPWWWVGLVLLCFLPAIYSVVVGFPPVGAPAPPLDADVENQPDPVP